jgi:hypothetical protein
MFVIVLRVQYNFHMQATSIKSPARTEPMTFRFPKRYARLIRHLKQRTGISQVKVLTRSLDISAKTISNGQTKKK